MLPSHPTRLEVVVDLPKLLVPLVTPFTDDASSVSEVRLARLVKHLGGQGVEGFVINSDVGEFTAMSFGELYRYNGEWKFRAIGQGYASGLAGIARERDELAADSAGEL